MDFEDTPEEAAFRAEARAFLEAHAPAGGLRHGRGRDLTEAVAKQRAWQRLLHEHGWSVPTWPAEWGGRALTPAHAVIWRQESARVEVGEGVLNPGLSMLGPTLIAHGSDDQKARFLEPTARGDLLWTQLFSEPSSGSDLASLGTRAVKDGDSWVVNGQKVWSSFANHADRGFLLVRSDPTLPKHAGVTFLLVDMHAPGVEVRPLVEMTGGNHFNEVFFSDVRVPDADRVGPVGGGWGVARTTLMHERSSIGGSSVLGHVERLLAFIRERDLEVSPVVADRIARLYTQAKGLDLLSKRMLTAISRGGQPGAEGSLMKNAMAEADDRGGEPRDGAPRPGRTRSRPRLRARAPLRTVDAHRRRYPGDHEEPRRGAGARPPARTRRIQGRALRRGAPLVNFAFDEEQEAFREAVERFVQEQWPITRSRELAETPSGFDPAVWRTMTGELGLAGLLVPEAEGGQGFSMLELGIALEALGAALAGGPLFASAVLGAGSLLEIATPDERRTWLPAIAEGDTIATCAHGEGIRAAEGRLDGEQRHVLDATNADLLLLAADDAEGKGLYVVEAGAPGLAVEALSSFDPTRKFGRIRCDGVAARRLGSGDATAGLGRLRALVSIAISADQVGGARACLAQAVDHVKTRVQFGRPVGSFQAVKHRAADATEAIELARSAAYWAWWVAAQDGPEREEAAAVVGSLCAQAYETAARECIHLHGGMGFTWEHDAHLYFRRARTDALLAGAPEVHRASLALRLGLRVSPLAG